VLNDLHCPIFTGVHVGSIPPHDPRPYRRIGVTIDLERDHKKVLRWAVDFAAAYQAKLYVIHGTPVAELVAAGAPIPAGYRNRLAEEAHDAVLNLLRQMKIEADIYVAPSAEPERIASEAAEAKNLDLLIAGRPHEEGILQRLSSHTYDVIRQAPCPVITL
jgi:nucleotide-binding universal stress UspA family protein